MRVLVSVEPAPRSSSVSGSERADSRISDLKSQKSRLPKLTPFNPRNRVRLDMARHCSFLLFTAGWAFIGLPTLCAGGALIHPCDCGHGEEEGCGHETDCESDPCEVVVVRPHDGQDAAQWLCDTLSHMLPFAEITADPPDEFATVSANSPASSPPHDVIARSTATTVLLI